MNSIEDACKIETKIVDSLVIVNMTLKDIEITDLRMMKFINYFKLLMDDLNDDRIHNILKKLLKLFKNINLFY